MDTDNNMSKVNFLYGQDYFSLKKYVVSLCSQSGLSPRAFNCADDTELNNFLELISAPSLFSDGAHIYAYNIFDNSDKIFNRSNFLKNPQMPIILAHGMPKEALVRQHKDLFKLLTSSDDIDDKEFLNLERKELISILKSELAGLDCDIEARALPVLFSALESQDTKTKQKFIDTQTLINYVKICGLYALSQDRNKILVEDVNLLVPDKKVAIFDCIDAVLSRNMASSVRLISKFLSEQDGGEGLFYLLSSQVKNLFIIKSMLGSGKKSDEINSRLKLNPWVFQKNVQKAISYDEKDLKNLYLRFINFDNGIRSGKIDHENAVWSIIY